MKKLKSVTQAMLLTKHSIWIWGFFFILLSFLARGVFAPTPLKLIIINEVVASNSQILVDEDGNYEDWIELYNPTSKPVNLRGYSLTDNQNEPDKWIFPTVTLQPKEYLHIWASGKNTIDVETRIFHTNFRLRSNGEFLGLYSSDGTQVDSISLMEQFRNVSFGRPLKRAGEWCFFFEPTPKSPNTASCAKITRPPNVTIESGFYEGPVTVALTATRNTSIHYTLDGSLPTQSSPSYTGPLILGQTSILRARAFNEDHLPSAIVTKTYFVGEDVHLPVLSLVTDPKNLWDDELGIYIKGPDLENPNYEQRGRDSERPAHIEFFSEDDTLEFSMNAGVRILGGITREYPKKSFILHFRRIYGPAQLEYSIFPGKDLAHFKSLVLRMGGNDGLYDLPRLRDSLMHALWAEQDGIVSAYRPVFLFLNGKPWGIYNFREHIDQDYLASNYGVDEVDLIRKRTSVKLGDLSHWETTSSFFEQHDLRQEDYFVQAQSMIDLQNFTDYQIFQIYAGNIDLVEENLIKYRPKTPEGKWRWIMWDMDVSFGLAGSSPVSHDSVSWFTRDRALPELGFWYDDGSDSLWATLILRKLLEVDNYRTDFINRFADLLNTTLHPDNVVSLINTQASSIEPDIPLDLGIWKEHWKDISYERWQYEIEILRDFARRRPDFLRYHLMNKFDLKGTALLTIEVPEPKTGKVQVNSVLPKNYPWSGRYFQDIPITLKAIPAPGYEFAGWNDPSLPNADNVMLSLSENRKIRPIFSHND